MNSSALEQDQREHGNVPSGSIKTRREFLDRWATINSLGIITFYETKEGGLKRNTLRVCGIESIPLASGPVAKTGEHGGTHLSYIKGWVLTRTLLRGISYVHLFISFTVTVYKFNKSRKKHDA
jgi:hypothetical protein